MFVAGIETAASNEVWIFRNGLFLVSLLLSLQAACNAVAIHTTLLFSIGILLDAV